MLDIIGNVVAQGIQLVIGVGAGGDAFHGLHPGGQVGVLVQDHGVLLEAAHRFVGRLVGGLVGRGLAHVAGVLDLQVLGFGAPVVVHSHVGGGDHLAVGVLAGLHLAVDVVQVYDDEGAGSQGRLGVGRCDADVALSINDTQGDGVLVDVHLVVARHLGGLETALLEHKLNLTGDIVALGAQDLELGFRGNGAGLEVILDDEAEDLLRVLGQ